MRLLRLTGLALLALVGLVAARRFECVAVLSDCFVLQRYVYSRLRQVIFHKLLLEASSLQSLLIHLMAINFKNVGRDIILL